MFIKPLLVEQDEDVLSKVGRSIAIVAHCLDMTGAFEHLSLVNLLDGHPRNDLIVDRIGQHDRLDLDNILQLMSVVDEIDGIPSDDNEGTFDTCSGRQLFQEIERHGIAVTLRNVTEHHGVLRELLDQFRIEFKASCHADIETKVDMTILPAKSRLQTNSAVNLVWNVFGEVVAQLADSDSTSEAGSSGQSMLLSCDRLLSTYPQHVESLIGNEQLNLVLTSRLAH